MPSATPLPLSRLPFDSITYLCEAEQNREKSKIGISLRLSPFTSIRRSPTPEWMKCICIRICPHLLSRFQLRLHIHKSQHRFTIGLYVYHLHKCPIAYDELKESSCGDGVGDVWAIASNPMKIDMSNCVIIISIVWRQIWFKLTTTWHFHPSTNSLVLHSSLRTERYVRTFAVGIDPLNLKQKNGNKIVNIFTSFAFDHTHTLSTQRH